jgi:hypothetical protein
MARGDGCLAVRRPILLSKKDPPVQCCKKKLMGRNRMPTIPLPPSASKTPRIFNYYSLYNFFLIVRRVHRRLEVTGERWTAGGKALS